VHTYAGLPRCPSCHPTTPQPPRPPRPAATAPKRIQWLRWSGSPLPANTRLVDRSTCFGNPFKIAKHGRERALELHRGWLRGDPDAVAQAHADRWRWPDLHGQALAALIRQRLAGYDLACPGCRLDEQCHADLLLPVAAARPMSRTRSREPHDPVTPWTRHPMS